MFFKSDAIAGGDQIMIRNEMRIRLAGYSGFPLRVGKLTIKTQGDMAFPQIRKPEILVLVSISTLCQAALKAIRYLFISVGRNHQRLDGLECLFRQFSLVSTH